MQKIVFLIVLFLSSLYANFAQPNSEYIIKLIRGLENQNPVVRDGAAEKLILLGDSILPVLMKNFTKDHYFVKRKKVYICGVISGNKAVEYLLQSLNDEDAGVRETAARMLLNLSDQYSIFEKLEVLSKDSRYSLEGKKTIEDLKNSILYKEIENEILYYISPDGNSGYFSGQFEKLKNKWRERAIIPMLNIFKNENYQCVNTHVTLFELYQMRSLAGEGLADLKDVYNFSLRWRVKRDLAVMAQGLNRHDQADDYKLGLIEFILYSIGYTSEFDNAVQYLKSLPQTHRVLYTLGMKYLRIRKLNEGISYLRRAINLDPTNDIYHYNLACAYSLARRLDEAVASLEASVDAGYQDLDWMLKDGDLRNIRKHPGFLKLVKRLKKKQRG